MTFSPVINLNKLFVGLVVHLLVWLFIAVAVEICLH